MESHALTCHPATGTAAVERIVVDVARTADGVLDLTFALDGDLSRLRIPSPAPPRVAHDLWRHTCFEAFVAPADGTAYHEINLAPSGAWGAFAFRAYRDGGPLSDAALAPGIVAHAAPRRLALTAHVPLARFSAAYAKGPLRLGLAAVVEETSGACSYWALHHPAAAPDFHHADGFRVRLPPPEAAC